MSSMLNERHVRFRGGYASSYSYDRAAHNTLVCTLYCDLQNCDVLPKVVYLLHNQRVKDPSRAERKKELSGY